MAAGENLFNQFENLLLEKVDTNTVVNMVIEDDDPAWHILQTIPAERIVGRRIDGAAGFEFSYRIKVSRGGAVEGGSFDDTGLTTAGANTHIPVKSFGDVYTDPTTVPTSGYLPIRVLLQRIKANYVINKKQIMADLATMPIDEVVGSHVEDLTGRLRGYILNYFYNDGTAGLATVNAALTVPTTAGGIAVPITDGTIFRFELGDRVQFTNTGYTAFKTPNPHRAWVVNIDADARTIFLQADATFGGVALIVGDKIVLEGTVVPGGSPVHLVPEGTESLIRSSGNFPGTSLDVTNHGYLRGFVDSNSGVLRSPTPELIAKVLDKMADRGIDPPEILIGDRSVWSYYAFLEKESGSQYVVPQGMPFLASGGVKGPVISHMEWTFQKVGSSRIKPNRVTGIAPSEWLKTVPFGNFTYQWFYGNGPGAGVSSVFNVVHTSGRTSELFEAPADSAAQFGLKRPMRNCRILDLKALRDV